MKRALLSLALGGLAVAVGPAWALYKVVNPDGSVTYTDRPPLSTDIGRIVPMGSRAASAPTGPGATPGPSSTAAPAAAAGPAGPDPALLPADLRQAVARYPATLYTTADCKVCATARQLLVQRGVPFTERRVGTEEDALQLERLAGARTVPLMMLGKQPLRGYAEAEWTSYLDAAGYPRQSRLPKPWQPAPAVPMSEAPAANASSNAANNASSNAAAPPAPTRRGANAPSSGEPGAVPAAPASSAIRF